MAYANTNTNQALRDMRGMLVQMPINRAERDYQSVLGRSRELEAMAGAQEAELRRPALQLNAEKAQTELDQMNSPFRIQNLAKPAEDPNKGPYDVGLFPDQAAMLVQDQKYGPPAMKQFEDNVRQMGYQVAPDGSFMKKDGTPVSYREAAPIHREWLRTMFLNTDMEKHRDNQVAYLESKGNLTPQETKALEKLKSISPLELAQMRLEKLQEIQMEDPMWGRPEGKLLQPMIQQAAMRVEELKGQQSAQAEMDWEREKLKSEMGWDREKFYATQAGLDRRANRGTAPNLKQLEAETQNALRHGIGIAQSEGLPIGYDEEGNLSGQLTQEQMARFKAIMGEKGHTVYAAPVEVTKGGEDWIPFNEKKETHYQVTDIVPSGQTEPVQTEEPIGLPQGAKQAPDGNYYVQQNGQWFRIDPEGQEQAEAPKAQTPKAPTPEAQPQPEPKPEVPMDRKMTEAPTPEQRQAAMQEMDALLSSVGLGAQNWKAAANVFKKIGGAAWDQYMRLYNLLAEPIAEAYSEEGRAEGRKRLGL